MDCMNYAIFEDSVGWIPTVLSKWQMSTQASFVFCFQPCLICVLLFLCFCSLLQINPLLTDNGNKQISLCLSSWGNITLEMVIKMGIIMQLLKTLPGSTVYSSRQVRKFYRLQTNMNNKIEKLRCNDVNSKTLEQMAELQLCADNLFGGDPQYSPLWAQ